MSPAPSPSSPSVFACPSAVRPPLARAARWLAATVGLVALATLAGCAHPPIKPWQREHLSKRAMRFDADPLESRFRQHLTGSREAGEGGYDQPGGGCGCN